MDTRTVELPAPQLRERPAHDLDGLPIAGPSLLALFVGIEFVRAGRMGGTGDRALITSGSLLILLGGLALAGLTTVAPGQARVVQLFDR